MKRSEFLKLCGLLGVTLPYSSAASIETLLPRTKQFKGKAIIIGAGAAGMTAGYLLKQKGIDFQILEATSSCGGRMKVNTDFADFPIPLGAEWLHVEPSVLSQIVNDPNVDIKTEFASYNLNDPVTYFEEGEKYTSTIKKFLGRIEDRKFINSTWFNFYEEYILPSVESSITYETPIQSIDYHGNQVIVRSVSGENYEAQKVIVTVPIKILQVKGLEFIPPLPEYKTKALERADVWSGFKAFFEFSKKFYDVYTGFPDSDNWDGQRLYYDAAYGQNSKQNILGLFSVGKPAEVYQKYSGDAQRDYILNELDQIYDGQASKHYLKHLVQDWNKEPYAQGAYIHDEASVRVSRQLAKPINEKVYFAGTSYTYDADWGSVHTAASSARDAIAELLG